MQKVLNLVRVESKEEASVQTEEASVMTADAAVSIVNTLTELKDSTNI